MKRSKLAYAGCAIYAGVSIGLLLHPRQLKVDPKPVRPGTYGIKSSPIPDRKPLAGPDAAEGAAF